MSKDKKPVKEDKKPVKDDEGGATTQSGPPYYDGEGIPCPDPSNPCI